MPNSLRILIAEDSQDDADLLLLELSKGSYTPVLKRVETAKDMQLALAEGGWDLVMSDYSMPGFGAPEALALCREIDPDLPFIVVSGTIGEMQAVEMMRAGASDYLLKSNLTRLLYTIERELRETKSRHERRQAAAEIARLAAIVESSGDAIFSETLDGIITTWNDGAETVFGWTEAEILGKHISFLVPEENAAELASIMEQVRLGNRFKCYETARRHRDGSKLDVFVTVSPIRDHNGQIVGYSKIARDITAQKRAEKSQSLLAAIVDSSEDAIISLDRDDRVQTWNQSAERLFGYTAAEAFERSEFLIPPHLIADIRDKNRRIWRGDHIPPFESVRLRKGGESVEVSISMSAVRVDGRIVAKSTIFRDLSHRNRTEQENRMLRSIIDYSPEFIAVSHLNERVIFVNRAGQALLGLHGDEEASRTTVADYHSVEEMDRIGREIMPVLRGGGSTRGEIAFRHFRTGAAIPAEAIIFGIPNLEDSKPTFLACVAHDITERKQIENQLFESKEELRQQARVLQSILDNMSDGVVVADERGKFVLFNPAAERMLNLGKTDSEPSEWQKVYSLYMPDGRTPYPTEELPLVRALRGEECEAVEMVVNHDRVWESRWISVNARPMHDNAGKLRGGIAVIRNVTEKKQAEIALQKSESRLKHVLASSPAILFTLRIADSAIGRINWISDNLKEILGYSPEETYGEGWWLKHIHPEERDEIVARGRDNLFGQGHAAEEYRFRHRNGHYVWTRSEMRLIRNETGESVEAVGAWSDISAHKHLEDQFHQAQKMEAFGQLAGGVAHDFNNLLTIINGYSDLVLQSLPKEHPSRKLVAEIYKAGERSAGLTRQLLAFSRQQILAPQVLNLNEVVAGTDKMLRRLIGEDIRLTTTLNSEPWAIRADPGQIEQVLLNLAVNARDAMPTGGRLTIETRNIELDETYTLTHKDSRPGPHVLLSVADTGTGMTPEIMAKIFEPFFTTKGPGKGTGLGLATVYGIVRQSGGHVAVYSEFDVGTTFKVYLPRAEQKSGVAKPQSRVLAPPRGSETILIAEDEAGVRILSRYVLTECGYKVLEADDGNEALKVAAAYEGPIHLLITDVVMPGQGGRAVAEQMTQLNPRIKVLYVSGYTDDAVIRHGVLREGVSFLQKPFSPVALAIKVREVLDAPAK